MEQRQANKVDNKDNNLQNVENMEKKQKAPSKAERKAAQKAADTYLKSIKAKEKELAKLTKQAKKNRRD